MRISKLLVTVAATALVAAPAMANQASSLSVAKAANVKAKSSAKKANQVAPTGVIVGIAAAAAVGLGIYVAVDEEDEAESDSN